MTNTETNMGSMGTDRAQYEPIGTNGDRYGPMNEKSSIMLCVFFGCSINQSLVSVSRACVQWIRRRVMYWCPASYMAVSLM